MSAFNARLKPKEIFGMPLPAALGLITALVFGVVVMAAPGAVKLLVLPLLLVALAVAGLAFWKGDDLPWLSVMMQAGSEDKRATSEVDGAD